jgi:hypothetical protein
MASLRSIQSLFLIALCTGGVGLGVAGISNLALHPTEVPWRWTFTYLAATAIFASLMRFVGLFWAPILTIGASFMAFCVITGIALPVLVSILVLAAAYVIGRLCLPSLKVGVSDATLAGSVILGTAVGLLAMTPLNTAGTYFAILVCVLILGRNHLATLFRLQHSFWSFGSQAPLVLYLSSAAAFLSLLVSLMPEVGHDGVGMHLLIAKYISLNGEWHFDVNQQLWAVMPMLVNWLYSISYMLGGETAARLTNFYGVCLLGITAYRISVWAGKDGSPAYWSMLIFFSTPLVFLETSSLFVDGFWSAMLVAGAFAIHRCLTEERNQLSNLYLGALLTAGAMSSKLLSVALLPVLLLQIAWHYKSWVKLGRGHLGGAVLVFVGIGIIPYINSFLRTGNPVFPFFNSLFNSPYYMQSDWDDPRWTEGPSLEFFYNVVFKSYAFMEGTPGAGGFQWLLLIPAALVITTLILPSKRTILLSSTLLGYSAIILWQTGYLRYLLPSVAFGSALVSVALDDSKTLSRFASLSFKVCISATVALNLIHLQSATWYGVVDLRSLFFSTYRDQYLLQMAPQRKAAELVNAMNTQSETVAIFGLPTIADLEGPQLTSSWYTWGFSQELLQADTPTELHDLLTSRGVKYLILNSEDTSQAQIGYAKKIGDRVAEFGPIQVRVLRNGDIE